MLTVVEDDDDFCKVGRYENKRPFTRFPIVVDGTSEDTSSLLPLKTDKGVYGVVDGVVGGAIFPDLCFFCNARVLSRRFSL